MIYFSKKRKIEYNDWTNMLRKLGVLQKLLNAKVIAIKPNLAGGSKADPKRHICTDINFLKNIIILCHKANPLARKIICESDSTGEGFAYLKFGNFNLPHTINAECGSIVETIDLSRDRLRKIKDERFIYFKNGKNLFISEELCNADFVISLSNLKTHSVTLYTGACKNLFGCLPTSTKSVYHPYIHQVVHDMTLALNPDLNVVDAFFAMEKNGPIGGNDIDGGVRIYSNSATEADLCGTRIIGIKPEKVKYLKLLIKNLQSPKLDHLQIKKFSFYAKMPGKWLRINNTIGLWIQAIGDGVSGMGDRIHTARNPIRAIISIFRPLLINIFGINKLKRLKKQINEKVNYDV